MKSNFKKLSRFAIVPLLFASAISFTGCSKDDDDNNSGGSSTITGKKVVITISVSSPIDASDYLSFVAAGSATNPSNTTIWKLNNVVQTSQPSIGLDEDDFSGTTKTYTIESTEPIAAVASSIQFINYGQDLKFSLKVTVDGVEKVNETDKVLSGDGADFSKNYSF